MSGLIAAVVRFISKDSQGQYDAVKRTLANKESALQELMKARDAIPPLIKDAEAICSRLGSSRIEVLVADSDEALAQHDAKATRQRHTLERLKAFSEEVETRIASLRDAEVAAEVLRLREDAQSKTKAFSDWISSKYPALAEGIVDGLRLHASADAAIAKYNSRAESKEKLLDIECSVRRGAPEQRQEISRTEKLLWCGDGSREPLSEALQARVRDNGDGTGSLSLQAGVVSNGPVIVQRRRFWCVEFLPYRGAAYIEPFPETLSLPAVRSGARPYWVPPHSTHYAGIQKQIEEMVRRPSSLPPRRVSVELIPMPETAAGEEAA